MPQNYDSTTVGNPFARTQEVRVAFPDKGVLPWITIDQKLAMKAVDGTEYTLSNLPNIIAPIDPSDNTPIPILNVNTGLPIASGETTTARKVLQALISLARVKQVQAELPGS